MLLIITPGFIVMAVAVYLALTYLGPIGVLIGAGAIAALFVLYWLARFLIWCGNEIIGAVRQTDWRQMARDAIAMCPRLIVLMIVVGLGAGLIGGAMAAVVILPAIWLAITFNSPLFLFAWIPCGIAVMVAAKPVFTHFGEWVQPFVQIASGERPTT